MRTILIAIVLFQATFAADIASAQDSVPPPKTDLGFDSSKVPPPDPKKGKPVARVLDQYIYPDQPGLNSATSDKDELLYLQYYIIGPLFDRHKEQEKINATPEEIAQLEASGVFIALSPPLASQPNSDNLSPWRVRTASVASQHSHHARPCARQRSRQSRAAFFSRQAARVVLPQLVSQAPPSWFAASDCDLYLYGARHGARASAPMAAFFSTALLLPRFAMVFCTDRWQIQKDHLVE